MIFRSGGRPILFGFVSNVILRRTCPLRRQERVDLRVFRLPAGRFRIGLLALVNACAAAAATIRRPMSEQPLAGDRPWLADFATVFAHLWYQEFPAHPA